MSRNLKREINEVFYVLAMFIIFMGVYIFLIKTGLSESESKNYSFLIIIAGGLLHVVVVPYIAARIKIKTDRAKWNKEFDNASDERQTEMLEAAIKELDKEFDRAVELGLISAGELEEMKKKLEAKGGA